MVFTFDAHAALARISNTGSNSAAHAKAGQSGPLHSQTVARIATVAGVRPPAEKIRWASEKQISNAEAARKTDFETKDSRSSNEAVSKLSCKFLYANTDRFLSDNSAKSGLFLPIAQNHVKKVAPATVAILATVRRLEIDLDAFAERAAIGEYDGGMNRAKAERVAAAEQGYADPSALYAAASNAWQHRLEALARRENTEFGPSYISAALAFIRGGWAEKAVALGWSEIELFGVVLHAPWERHGAAYLPFTPSTLTAECITYFRSSEPTHRRWRQALAADAVLPWDLDDHGSRSSVPT